MFALAYGWCHWQLRSLYLCYMHWMTSPIISHIFVHRHTRKKNKEKNAEKEEKIQTIPKCRNEHCMAYSYALFVIISVRTIQTSGVAVLVCRNVAEECMNCFCNSDLLKAIRINWKKKSKEIMNKSLLFNAGVNAHVCICLHSHHSNFGYGWT